MAQKPVLGKGLASLLPSFPGAGSPTQVQIPPQIADEQVNLNKDRIPGVGFSAVDEIRTNPYQPRHDFDEAAIEELAQSIRENGLIQPIIVRKAPVSGYELIAGERRLRAAKLAGLKQVPIVVRKSTDRESLEIAIIENIQRQDLNPMDEALAYQQLTEEFHLTQEEVAKRVGKERASVANFLRLLKLPDAIQRKLRMKELSFGHAKVLLGLESSEEQLKLAELISTKNLSVRALEELVSAQKNQVQAGGQISAQPAKPLTKVQARLFALSQELTRKWSTRVSFKGSDKRGKILIEYHSREELERLLTAMQNQ